MLCNETQVRVQTKKSPEKEVIGDGCDNEEQEEHEEDNEQEEEDEEVPSYQKKTLPLRRIRDKK